MHSWSGMSIMEAGLTVHVRFLLLRSKDDMICQKYYYKHTAIRFDNKTIQTIMHLALGVLKADTQIAAHTHVQMH